MDVRQLLWGASPWWILVCLLAGLLYAGLLYSKKQSLWGPATNWSLFAIRFLLASLLCLLLLEPYLRQLTRHIEAPSWVIAIDNSLSVAEGGTTPPEQLRQTLARLQQQLGPKGRVEFRTLNGPLEVADSLRFGAQATDLSSLLTGIRSDYENRNLAGVVLLTDGIYNQGMSPAYVPYPFPVHTLGLGDTLPKTDVNLKNLYYNKVAYQGNQFRIRAEITQNGYAGQAVTLNVRLGGKVLQQKQLRFPNGASLLEEEVVLNADEAGLQHYIFEVSGAPNEYTLSNNRRHAYVEIIEGREKILIAAASPHPDITALRRAIEKNQNYQTFVYIPGLSPYQEEEYDLVILHGLPGRNLPRLEEILNKTRARWYMVSSQTDLRQLNLQQDLVQINSQQQEFDEVFPLLNGTFTLFTYAEENRRAIGSYSPVQVPFGRLQVASWGQVLLQQRVGRIETDKPLLVVGVQEEKKIAVMLGEGLWQWRLQEYAATEDFKAFDELVQKTVQLLASRDDRRRFRVYPLEEEVLDTEGVVFETEVYNTLYERIWGQGVNLVITDEGGKQYRYSYQNSRNNPRYAVRNLPQGVYQFRATTELEGETLSSSGRFSVQNLQLESLELTANHNLLRGLSEKTGGRYYHYQQEDQLLQDLGQLEARNIITADEAYESALSLEWLLALLLLLVSVEWFVRKYNGGY
ncbi:hypothetical protein [Cesiribacter andamanensis]|uniref:Putative membrane protein n=1 Tax=Cesiribacter andamanensis AMV16 TaxID=1279009 RepID=M7P0F5_9BACT|nr:hypothetical protein [Cesiribacter andamanensis]EMR04084.1 putative membrane protein [Cesiribacter andamanensis AMV16]